jgi:hypothetical protein
MVAQVLYWNGVTLCTAAIRRRQPGTKPGGQQISFPAKLLAATGLALMTAGSLGTSISAEAKSQCSPDPSRVVLGDVFNNP